MSEIEAIVQATHVLSGLSVINIQDLLPYQNKLENTLRILERSLEAIQRRSSQLSGSVKPSLRPYSPTSSPDPQPPFQHGSDEPSPRPSSSSQPSTPRADERNSLVSDESENLGSDARSLLQALGDSKRSKKILDYLSSGSDPINGSQNDWIQEDPRVNDIKFCSTNRSLDAKFRRGLGQRSLAIEYDEWEQKIFNTSRVSELCRDLSAADQHDGHINQFLRENTHRFKDEKSASHGIRHGIRLLVFERTYEHVGVSAILILVYSQFRSVKYKNYLLLKELLQKDHLWGSLASGKSSWFRQCEKQYEARVKTWQKFQASWQPTCGGQKRQRTTDVQLLSHQLPPNAYPVLPTDIPENHDEQPNGHTAQTVGSSTIESNNIIQFQSHTSTQDIQQSFHAEDDTTTAICPAPLSAYQSWAPNLDHQFLVTESSTPLSLTDRGEITRVHPVHDPGSQPRLEGPQRGTPPVGSSQLCDTRVGGGLALAQPSPLTLAFDEQDLIEQMVTRPYNCSTAVQIAFDASMALDYLSTGDFFNE